MIKPICPKYTSPTANTPIELGAETVELRAGAVTVKGFGKACLELDDKERVIIEVETSFDSCEIADHENLQMRFGPKGQFVPVISVRWQLSDAGVTLRLLVNRSPFVFVRDRRVRLSFAIAHILNFPEFFSLGGATDLLHDHQRLGRVIVSSDDWEIELQALTSTNAVIEQLKIEGGNAITHVARIARVDGRSFTCKQLDRVVWDFQRFLSFSRGAWTSVFGTVGYSRTGQEAYEDWSQRIAAPWQVCRSWFDIHHGEALVVAFPGFVKLMHDPTLARAGNAALHWYLQSNRAGAGAGVDGGLILSQAALEGLAVAVLGSRGVSIASNAKASNKIRAACEALKISTTIPRSSKALQAWKKRGAFRDGPEAVTRLRNELVHPKGRLTGKLAHVIPQVWNLAQWYIEVILLKLCGYKGVYSFRLKANWVGEVRKFP